MKFRTLSANFGLFLLLSACTLDEVFETGGGLDALSVDEKVVLGLRKALELGIDSSSQAASKVGGYLTHKVIKILLPEEANKALLAAEELAATLKPLTTQLKSIQLAANLVAGLDKSQLNSNLASTTQLITNLDGLESISDSLVKYMNLAAELAALSSVPIFKNAITSMSIVNGLTILNSSDSTAATQYLNGKTFSPLVTAYTPIVDSTLQLVHITRFWGDFRSLYNNALEKYTEIRGFQQSWNQNNLVANIPALQINKLKVLNYDPIETESLSAWTTDKALIGLFYLVGNEEKKIRRDPLSYIKTLAGDLAKIIRDVFGDIMEMEKK